MTGLNEDAAVGNLSKRSRSALIWGLVLFAASEFALFRAMEAWPVLRHPEYGRKLARLRTLSTGEGEFKTTIVFLGSSRAAVGLRPDTIMAIARQQSPGVAEVRAFNFSLMASGPLVEVVCLKRLLKEGVHPQLIVAEVWPSLLYLEDGDHPVGLPIDQMAATDIRILSPYASNSREMRWRWWREQLPPCWASRKVLRRLFVPQLEPDVTDLWFQYVKMDEWGWEQPGWERHRTDAFEKSEAVCRTLHGPILHHFRVSPSADRALRDLLEICRRKKIAAQLLLLPDSCTFQRYYPPATQTEVKRYLRQLCLAHGASLVDSARWYQDDDFADVLHLTSKTAQLLSERVAREMIVPFLRSSSRRTDQLTRRS